MLEHMTQDEAADFLVEIHRIFQPGGYLRLVVPEIARIIEGYNQTKDADAFMAATLLSVQRPKAFWPRLANAVFVHRDHVWTYDAKSRMKLLSRAGFVGVFERKAGETGIPDLGALNLREREEDSIYVEVREPLLNSATS